MADETQRALERFAREKRTGEVHEAIPAATVILLRDTPGGHETLLLRRNSRLGFGGGAWVFPGGRVDPDDWPDEPSGDPERDEEAAARRAAVREAEEEAALVVDEAALVPFAHWVPPPEAPKRFSTWFFVVAPEATAVTVDGGEIVDHVWARPAEALSRHAAGEVELLPPTWLSLLTLSNEHRAAEVVAAAEARALDRYATRIAAIEGGIVALYEGDAGYDDVDPHRPGSRHRLWMIERDWRYERD
jgi:8-oxo-dGTP pyrophosphatase MutT (NUDIX family)